MDHALALVGLFSVAYTTLGGIMADIWSDIIQLIVLWSGTLASLFFLARYDGGAVLSSIPAARTQTLAFGSAGFGGSGDFSFWPMVFGSVFLYISCAGSPVTSGWRGWLQECPGRGGILSASS